MKASVLSGLLPLALGYAVNAAGNLSGPKVIKRQADLLPEYDYVVVGGGVSGLTVANRLTEDSNTTVLVIEAGKIDNYSKDIQYPRFAQTVYENYSWPITSLPTAGLNNRTTSVVAARLLGGGSAINGMAFTRGSPGDYDLWAELVGDDAWGWDGLLPYFKKCETFTPPTEVQQSEHGISFDLDVHGTNGPIQSSFPPFITTTGKVFLTALRQLGIPTQLEGSAKALGGYWSPNNLDPATRERSYARTGYHDRADSRPNYHVLPEALVTKLTPDLTGVKYSAPYNPGLNSTTADTRSKIRTVRARKEIIMAAGAIHTPKILHLSGVGSSSILRSLGIDQILDIPGVGENLQDHATLYGSLELTNLDDPTQDPNYLKQNATYDAEMGRLYEANRTGPWTVGTENTLSFLAAKHLNFSTSNFVHAADQSPAKYLRPDIDHSVVRGYEKAHNLLLKYMAEDRVALTENLLVTIISLQKPLSRGSVHAASADPYKMPEVSYRTFSNPLDLKILAQAVHLNTDLLPQTQALKSIGAVVTSPEPGLATAELMSTIRESAVPSFFHPGGTCAMLKFEDGGCVDNELRLYGSRGRVRVVDASIFPVIPSAHTQSTVYAVAEKAADLIKGVGVEGV